MNNKKGVNLTKQWSQKIQKIYSKAQQNQLNLQSFYRTNKLRLPPLLQSKNFILNNFSSLKLQQQSPQIIKCEITQKQTNLDEDYQYSSKSRPNICPIIFKHTRGRKYSFVHSNNTKIRNSKTIDIEKGIKETVSKNNDKNALKFINEENTPKNSLSTLFNCFYTSRTILDSIRQRDHKDSRDNLYQNINKQELNQSILVNNAVTVSPEKLFLQSLNRSRTHLLGIQRQLIVKRNSRLDPKKINIYKNANGILHQKKKSDQKLKQIVKFEPWQMTNPEDQIREIAFQEMKSCKI